MNGHDGNVAFKFTYNDGGTRGFVGFDGTCSDGNILRNVQTNPRPWCSNEDNLCRQFLDGGFLGEKPVHPCYESAIFERWRFGPGVYIKGRRAGEPIPINNAQAGKVALLTTRHPMRDTETERIVFGVCEIERVRADGRGEIWIECSAEHAIRLSESSAMALPYWEFKQGNPIWGTGLFRYMPDQEVTNFLHALNPHLRSAQERAVLERLLACCGNLEPEPAGETVNTRAAEAALEQKYGPGGEGEPHRALKQYIADHPECLGFGPGQAEVEHRFVTGDRVDVSVELADGRHCVVEIEVEGEESTRIGAHQALKYRALRAGELDSTEQPHACLVAYSIPQRVIEFCARHGISALEVDPVG